jgi:ribosomal protein S18 acetylase RimI-like enzyme
MADFSGTMIRKMESLHIRNARRSDLETIRDVTLAAYQEYASHMPRPHWQAYRREILTTLADVRPAEQIVAELNGAIVGTVLLYPAGDVLFVPDQAPVTIEWPEVRLLAVAPAARGRGVGLMLMEECVKRARYMKSTVLTLHTIEMMQSARRLYDRLGFVRAPELDFYIPEEDLKIKGYRLNIDNAAS